MATKLTTALFLYELCQDLYLTHTKFQREEGEGNFKYIYFNPNLTTNEQTTLRDACTARLFSYTTV